MCSNKHRRLSSCPGRLSPAVRDLDFQDQGRSPPSPEGTLALPFAGARASSVPATMLLVGPGLDAGLHVWHRSARSWPCPPAGHGGCGPQGDFEGPSGGGKGAWRAAPGSAPSLRSPGAVGLAIGVSEC